MSIEESVDMADKIYRSPTKNIFSAFIKAQKNFERALKTSNNPIHRSKYADLATCVDAVKDALNEQGIAFIQKHHDVGDNYIAIETVFIHESGETFSNGMLKIPAVRYGKDSVEKYDSQSFASASSYARRYSLMAACGIAPEDDDGNKSSGYNQNNYNQSSANKPMLNQKVDQLKEAQAQKKKETLLAKAEDMASMGLTTLELWAKNDITKEEQDIIREKWAYLKSKCPSENINQDVQQ